MFILRESTLRRINRAIKYPSITGGRGVRVLRQPGGGIGIGFPGIPDTSGLGGFVNGPFSPPNPYNPYEPTSPSADGEDRPNIYGAGYQP